MHIRQMTVALGGIALCAAALAPAGAQNEAPFTIRRPPDGATVREKVRIAVPLASIPEDGYVAYSIDGQFRVALAPTAEQREKMKPGDEFVYVWDTKLPVKMRGSVDAHAPADGQHTILATLYAPKGSTVGGSVAKQSSSVNVTVANKFTGTDPGAIRLRYQFQDGSNRTYQRDGNVSIVTGLSQGMQGTGDQELIGQSSRLLVAVEDKYDDGTAIVRNKLQELTVRQGGTEANYPSEQLPKSLYQQLSATGEVLYQNDTFSFNQFAEQGIPVDTTINLPALPPQSVRIGDKWTTPNQTLEIPGTPPNQQPHVTLNSTLAGIEWEGGYPTARIHQTYDTGGPGAAKAPKVIVVGNVEVENPSIKFERDIYLAYRSGTLIKVERTITITGKTSQQFGTSAGTNAGLGGGAMLGGLGAGDLPGGGMMAGGGSGSAYMAAQMGRMRGGPTGGPGMRGGGAPGDLPGGGQMGRMMRSGGPTGGPGQGRSGRMMGSGGMISGAGPGMMGRGGMMSGAMMRGGPGAMLGGGTGFQPQQTQQITLKATTSTELTK